MSPRQIAKTSFIGPYFDLTAEKVVSIENKEYELKPDDIPDEIPLDGTPFQSARRANRPKKTIRQAEMASDREYVDLKLEVADARTATKFAEFDGKLDRIVDSLNALGAQIGETRTEIRSAREVTRAETKNLQFTVVVTGITIFLAMGALFIGIATYGDALFGRGMNVRDVVTTIVREQAERASAAKPATDTSKNQPAGSR